MCVYFHLMAPLVTRQRPIHCIFFFSTSSYQLDPELLAMLDENANCGISKSELDTYHKEQKGRTPLRQSSRSRVSLAGPAVTSNTSLGATPGDGSSPLKYRKQLSRAPLPEEEIEIDIDARINAIAAGYVEGDCSDDEDDDDDLLTVQDPETAPSKWVRGGRRVHVL
eukprot:TRINITY_DN2774_c1_g2_i3.p2 TRINITY_DN2774_c1_g2~~TRINITY_DN2774_c1_g2_i3.p2  ORF type:complete len:167 (-),score=41.94 TRINITY_DN2774_c1_g2_i3:713-1213(-)